MAHTRRVRITRLAALVLAVAGCSVLPRPAVPVIDTWAVGEPLACTNEDPQRTCEELVVAGLAGLAERDGPAEVVSWSLHRDGSLIDPATGVERLSTRSGGQMSVLVAELADGTRRAIGVSFPGISADAEVVPWAVGR
jgi:hypothetical protein